MLLLSLWTLHPAVCYHGGVGKGAPTMPFPMTTHCAFDPLWEEKSLVDCVDGIIAFNITLPLQQDWSGVQSIISPEYCEPALFVTMDQRPAGQRPHLKDLGLLPLYADPDLMTSRDSPVDC